jgi:hypothetical protein
MLLHLRAAEQFCSQRRLIADVFLCQVVATEVRFQIEHISENSLIAYRQV